MVYIFYSFFIFFALSILTLTIATYLLKMGSNAMVIADMVGVTNYQDENTLTVTYSIFDFLNFSLVNSM